MIKEVKYTARVTGTDSGPIPDAFDRSLNYNIVDLHIPRTKGNNIRLRTYIDPGYIDPALKPPAKGELVDVTVNTSLGLIYGVKSMETANGRYPVSNFDQI